MNLAFFAVVKRTMMQRKVKRKNFEASAGELASLKVKLRKANLMKVLKMDFAEF